MVDGIRLLAVMGNWILLYSSRLWGICGQVWIIAILISLNHYFSLLNSCFHDAGDRQILWQVWIQDVRLDFRRFSYFRLSYNTNYSTWLPSMLVELFPNNLKRGFSSHLYGSNVGIYFLHSARITGWDGFRNYNLLVKSRDYYNTRCSRLRSRHHNSLTWLLLGWDNSLSPVSDKCIY